VITLLHPRVALAALTISIALVLGCSSSNNNAGSNAKPVLPSAATTRPATPAVAGATSASTTTAGPATTARPAGSPAAAAPSATTVSGDVTVYAALTQANADAIRDAYQKAFPGATVSFFASGTGAITSKLDAEARAGGIQADVIWLADPTAMQDLVAQGRFLQYTPAAAAALPKEDVDAGGYYTGIVIFNNVIIFNTKSNLPKPTDWSDLTKPEFQNQLEIGDPSYSGTTFIEVATLIQKYGADYFKSLKQRNATVVQSTSTVGTDVAAGQFAAGITLDSVVRPLVQKGSPVELIWPASGAIPVPGPAGIVKSTKKQAAAQQFIDWLLSSNGQKFLVSLGYSPVSPDAAAGVYPPGLHAPLGVDLAQALAKKQDTLDQFAAIFPR